jgi:hypothetical protein
LREKTRVKKKKLKKVRSQTDAHPLFYTIRHACKQMGWVCLFTPWYYKIKPNSTQKRTQGLRLSSTTMVLKIGQQHYPWFLKRKEKLE